MVRGLGSAAWSRIRAHRVYRPAGAALLLVLLLVAGCGTSAGYEVALGTYRSVVPSEEQLRLDTDGDLPGAFSALRSGGVEEVEVVIDTDEVVFRLDGVDTALLGIIDRVDITDSEGSGPFKATKQVLVLGDGPLVLGDLVIDDPVIWPWSFEGSPVITIKPRDPEERGPTISCRADESCLLVSSGVDPIGSYADANNPELDENPIDSIAIDDSVIDVTLDNGNHVILPVADGSFTRACGLSENPVWDLPAELGLPIDDPVLVHVLCPSTPGAGIQLEIMDRSALPILAPLTEATEGNWCVPSPQCLLFVST